MARKDASHGHKPTSGFTLTELLSVLAILAVLVAIFFPLFQQPRSSPNGAVQDGSGKPIPGATLRFRDQTGRIVATATSDDYGGFRRDNLDALSKNAVDGFGLTRARRRTGAGTLYTFTPLGTQIATFRDTSGNPIAGLAVSVGPDIHTWQWPFHEPFDSVSDNKGIIQVVNTPTGGRFGFQSQDPNYIVERTQVTVDGNTIRYAVTVTAPATITGCLRGEDSRPLRGYKAFATVSPDLNHFDRWYADSLVTGLTGRFRITNLRARTYYVSVAPARGYHALLPAQRVTLASGQTAEVSLRADGADMEQTPDAP